MMPASVIRDRIARLATTVLAILFAVAAGGSTRPMVETGETTFPSWTGAPQLPTSVAYHYSLTARVRPLLVFWITRPGVGIARIVRGQDAGARSYELLIGSDPERAPMRINRWGYVTEVARGDATELVGVMTESDEQTVDQARAKVDRSAQAGGHGFKAIRASIASGNASAQVLRTTFQEDYTLRDLRAVLDRLPEGRTPTARLRVPEGAGRGFLSALADLIDRNVAAARASGRVSAGESTSFVYDRGLYDLAVRTAKIVRAPRAGGSAAARSIESDFEIRNCETGNTTGFRLVYGTDGSTAGVPLRIVYRPRWWFEAELTLEEQP